MEACIERARLSNSGTSSEGTMEYGEFVDSDEEAPDSEDETEAVTEFAVRSRPAFAEPNVRIYLVRYLRAYRSMV